jgi:hypothetical protein
MGSASLSALSAWLEYHSLSQQSLIDHDQEQSCVGLMSSCADEQLC